MGVLGQDLCSSREGKRAPVECHCLDGPDPVQTPRVCRAAARSEPPCERAVGQGRWPSVRQPRAGCLRERRAAAPHQLGPRARVRGRTAVSQQCQCAVQPLLAALAVRAGALVGRS